MQYHHRQFGTFIVAALAAAIIILSLSLLRSESFDAVQLPVFLVLLAGIALFYALTIEIREDTLYIRMGIGLIRKKVPLSEIAEARKVRIPVYAGWGIHGIPGLLWVWNVSGRDGVELGFKRGGRLIVGSDEPDVLVQAIESSKAD
jgi:hypothetical protein